MKGPFEADDAATPLTPAERDGLIPTYVVLRGELNELEQQNIADASGWAYQRKRNVLDEAFLRGLHRRMFNKVWRWAGKYRRSERNLGDPPHLIQPHLVEAINDARYWIEHQTYDDDELSIRFSHRIVSIHPFPNGNRRWSRLAADLLITAQGRSHFSWGSADLRPSGDVRMTYVDALRAADAHEYAQLIAFARS